MKAYIIPSQKIVSVNDDPLIIKDFSGLSDVDNVSIMGEKCVVLYNDGSAVLEDVGDYQSYIDLYNSEKDKIAEEQDNVTINLPQYLATYRERKIKEGITVNGISIKGDDTTQTRMLGARIEAENDSEYTVDWKAVNGKVTLTAAQVISVSSALREHIQKCFDAYFTVEANIDDYDTTADIEAAFDSAYNGE